MDYIKNAIIINEIDNIYRRHFFNKFIFNDLSLYLFLSLKIFVT